MLTLNEKDNQRELSVSESETIELHLAENRTTGFRWIFKSRGEPVCELVGESFVPNSSAGAGGTHTWQFEVKRLGRGVVALGYMRSWEQTPASTFTVKIRASV
jgi:predicted secreted protein